MAILRSSDGKFYEVPDEQLDSYEIPSEEVKSKLEDAGDMPAGPRGGMGPGELPPGVVIQVYSGRGRGGAGGRQQQGPQGGTGGQEGEVQAYNYCPFRNCFRNCFRSCFRNCH